MPDSRPFRLRNLLNPFYILQKSREIRSREELLRRAANVLVYARDLAVNTGYAVRGWTGVVRLRTKEALGRVGISGFAVTYERGGWYYRAEAAYYRLRGWPHYWREHAAVAWYRVRGWPHYWREHAEVAWYRARGELQRAGRLVEDARDGLRDAARPAGGLSGPRLGYQAGLSRYVTKELRSFEVVRLLARERAGGFRGKDVLEIGAGIGMPHGGVFSALAAADGARRAVAIDRRGPPEGADPARAAFWRELAARRPDVDAGRVETAVMDAASMSFPDGSFDLAFCSAVFEHLTRPRETLREMLRVLRPGGRALIIWNPFTSLRMGAHDAGLFNLYPWAHLRFTEDEHVRRLAEVFSDPRLVARLPVEHRPSPELAREYAADPRRLYRTQLEDLNRMRVGTFRSLVSELGWRVLWDNCAAYPEDRSALSPELRAELSGYTEEELTLFAHEIVLERPALR